MTPLLLLQQAIKQRKAKAAASTAIERLSRRLEPKLRKRFLEAVKLAKAKVDLETLAKAVLNGSITQAELALKLAEWPERFGDLAIDMRAGFVAGSSLAYESVRGASFNLAFDLINAHAVNYAQRKLPQIVGAYQEGARQIIRDIIAESVGGKHTAQEAAKLLRDSIGLTPRYEQAVRSLEARLKTEGISGERLETKVDKYRQKLLRARSLTIARTEISQATMKGQMALWREAATQGLFRTHEATLIWRAGPEAIGKDGEPIPCPICRFLDGQEIAFGGLFSRHDGTQATVFGDPLTEPPQHPNCRCHLDLIIDGARALADRVRHRLDIDDVILDFENNQITVSELLELIRSGLVDKADVQRSVLSGALRNQELLQRLWDEFGIGTPELLHAKHCGTH